MTNYFNYVTSEEIFDEVEFGVAGSKISEISALLVVKLYNIIITHNSCQRSFNYTYP